jgi:hypothetical protein
LLGLKLVLLIWNAAVYDRRTLDAEYHADRALFGGLRASDTTHDGPLYYLPALLLPRPDVTPLARATTGEEDEPAGPSAARPPRIGRAEKALRADLLDWLRYSNVLWLGAFYVVCIYQVFSRLLTGFRPWFLASLLLLALPGYQRLGALSHPDNAFVTTASLALWAWLVVRERWQRGRVELAEPPAREARPREPLRFVHLALFALSIGVMSLTRSFAAVPAAVLAVVCVVYTLRSVRGKWAKRWPRLLGVVAILGVLGSAWTINVRRAMPLREPPSYFPTLHHSRAGFAYGRYYRSFRLGALLHLDAAPAARLENSFFTLLYSDTWGDQWSAFSNGRDKDGKEWAVRALLGAALAVPPLVLTLGVAWLVSLAGRVRSAAASGRTSSGRRSALGELEPELVLAALVVLGSGSFAYWQATSGLLPGDNSTVKFSYVATLFPPALALIWRRELTPNQFGLVSSYLLSLNVIAFPVAMYWPR